MSSTPSLHDAFNSSEYAAMARHVAPAAEQLIALVGEPRASARLLDVGTGTGNVLTAARAAGWPQSFGIDIAFAQLWSEVHGIAVADAQALPFRSASFDAVVSNFGLIFAPEVVVALAEAARCLDSDGILALTAWAPGGWPESARRLIGGALGVAVPPFPVELGEPDSASRLVRAVGLADISIERSKLTWRFADAGQATQHLTVAAGGLRALRRRSEAERSWGSIEPAMDEHFGSIARTTSAGIEIDDHVLTIIARRPRRHRN